MPLVNKKSCTILASFARISLEFTPGFLCGSLSICPVIFSFLMQSSYIYPKASLTQTEKKIGLHNLFWILLICFYWWMYMFASRHKWETLCCQNILLKHFALHWNQINKFRHWWSQCFWTCVVLRWINFEIDKINVFNIWINLDWFFYGKATGTRRFLMWFQIYKTVMQIRWINLIYSHRWHSLHQLHRNWTFFDFNCEEFRI